MKNKIKKCLAILLVSAISISCVGCGVGSDHVVKAVMPKEDASDENNLKLWIEKGREFSTTEFENKTIAEFLSGGENKVYSPVNVFIALSMLAEACNGETQDEILSLLGSKDTQTLRQKAQAMWNANYLDDEKATKIANSLWLNEQISFRDDLLDTYAEEYYASTFFGKMGTDKMDTLLRDWVNENTGHQLEKEVSTLKTASDTLVEILSTIFFRARWTEECKFDETFTIDRAFSGKNGTRTVPMMTNNLNGEIYETDQYAECELDLTQGKMCFFKPKPGVEIDDILKNGGVTEALHRHDKGAKKTGRSWSQEIHWNVPRFEIHSDLQLIDGLEKLGINKVFSQGTADLSNLIPQDEAEKKGLAPYVNRIKHDAMVKIDEEGVTAAAFTEIAATEGAVSEPDPIYEFILDEPFIYAIVGNDGSLLFVGTVYDI